MRSAKKLPRSSPIGPCRKVCKVIASTRINGLVNRPAISSDRSRIAASIFGGQYYPTEEVRLYDRNLNTILSLSESPDFFDDLQLSPDRAILRAMSYAVEYEQDLRLKSRLDTARNRLEAWAWANDLAMSQAKAREEKVLGASGRSPTKILSIVKRRSRARGRCPAWQSGGRGSGHRWVWPAASNCPAGATFSQRSLRKSVGDYRDAVEDFSTAINVPHMLPALKMHLESSRELYQSNLQINAELYLRRAFARAAVRDWRSIIGDVRTRDGPVDPRGLAARRLAPQRVRSFRFPASGRPRHIPLSLCRRRRRAAYGVCYQCSAFALALR
jgi:hypothetical protein